MLSSLVFTVQIIITHVPSVHDVTPMMASISGLFAARYVYISDLKFRTRLCALLKVGKTAKAIAGDYEQTGDGNLGECPAKSESNAIHYDQIETSGETSSESITITKKQPDAVLVETNSNLTTN